MADKDSSKVDVSKHGEGFQATLTKYFDTQDEAAQWADSMQPPTQNDTTPDTKVDDQNQSATTDNTEHVEPYSPAQDEPMSELSKPEIPDHDEHTTQVTEPVDNQA